MVITQPTLLPLPGYVEIERNGKRVYRRVADGAIYDPESGSMPEPIKTNTDELLDILLGVSVDG